MNWLRQLLEMWTGETAEYVSASTLDACIRERERQHHTWATMTAAVNDDQPSKAWPRAKRGTFPRAVRRG